MAPTFPGFRASKKPGAVQVAGGGADAVPAAADFHLQLDHALGLLAGLLVLSRYRDNDNYADVWVIPMLV
jgi:hypothetical protein